MISPVSRPHKSYVREFISAAKIPPGQQRGQVRQLFRHKLSEHLSRLQHHQLREDRFALAHELALQKHEESAQRAKEFLQLKQHRALQNKSHSLLERSRRAEGELTRWESIVGRNREKYERELQEAKTVIRLWNEKLEESSTRKSTHLQGLSNELKLKQEAREKRILTLRLKGELSPLSPSARQLRSPKIQARKSGRISTQNFLQRRKQQEEEQARQSIMRTVGKQERINQARYMRHYFQERKRKQQFDKEQILKAMRENNLTAIRDSHELRAQLIEKRLAKERLKDAHEEPLRQVEESGYRRRGTQSLKAVFNNFGEETPSPETSPNRNYAKMMTEKLKDISSMVRKHRSKH